MGILRASHTQLYNIAMFPVFPQTYIIPIFWRENKTQEWESNVRTTLHKNCLQVECSSFRLHYCVSRKHNKNGKRGICKWTNERIDCFFARERRLFHVLSLIWGRKSNQNGIMCHFITGIMRVITVTKISREFCFSLSHMFFVCSSLQSAKKKKLEMKISFKKK